MDWEGFGILLEKYLSNPPNPPLIKGGGGGISMVRRWPNGYGEFLRKNPRKLIPLSMDPPI
jgi:hypothetical protein